MDISMIRAPPLNTLVQRASYIKNMEIFSILICDIEKALAPKSTTDPAKNYRQNIMIYSMYSPELIQIFYQRTALMIIRYRSWKKKPRREVLCIVCLRMNSKY